MHETLCFSRQSASPNVDDLPLRCDGCETVSCVVGSFSDHSRTMVGSWPDRFRIVNGVSSVFRACAVDRIPLWFATVGSFPQCKWDCKWCWWMSCRWSFEGSLARNAVLRDSRCTKAYVFPYKVRPRTSMIYLCGATGARRSRVWSDHSRIMVGSWSDRFRIVNGVSSVFRACAVDRIPLWFATVGSFPQCKWDCKWCWWMSCRWSFEGSLARNAFFLHFGASDFPSKNPFKK